MFKTPGVPVQKGILDKAVYAEGKVIPKLEVDVASKMAGKVQKVEVNEGSFVHKGQLLLTLENKDLQARVLQAQAALLSVQARLREAETGPRIEEIQEAEALVSQAHANYKHALDNYKRNEDIYHEGAISPTQLEMYKNQLTTARAQYDAALEKLTLLQKGSRMETLQSFRAQVAEARAMVNLAKANLESSYIYAPLSGKAIYTYVDAGEMVMPGTPLLRLADMKKTLVRVEVDETDVGLVKLGQNADITSDAFPDKTFKGKVVEIGSSVGTKQIVSEDPKRLQDSKVLETKVEVFSPEGLKLGMTVDVKLEVIKKENVVLLPRSSVKMKKGKPHVRLYQSHKAQWHPVELGLCDDVHCEVKYGLKAGDRVEIPQDKK